MAVVDLIAGQHLAGTAVTGVAYTISNTYGGGQYIFNAASDEYADGGRLSEVVLWLVDLPAEIAAAKISQLVFSGGIVASGSVGQSGVDYLANSQLYQMTLFSFSFDPNDEPEGEFVTITPHSNGIARLFSNFTVATDNVDLSFDELTTGRVLKIGFPTEVFLFGGGFDFTLTLTEATLEVVDADTPDFWTNRNLTRELPL